MEYSIQLNAVNNPDKSVRAFATVVFGDSFKVTNVAVIEGQQGQFRIHAQIPHKGEGRVQQSGLQGRLQPDHEGVP